MSGSCRSSAEGRPQASQGVLEGLLCAESLDRHVHTASRDPPDLLDHIAVAVVERDVRPHLPGHGETCVVPVDANHERCPHQLGARCGTQSDRPLGENHDGIPNAHAARLGAREAGGGDVGQEHHLLVRQIVRDPGEVRLCVGNEQVLGAWAPFIVLPNLQPPAAS